MRSFIAGAFAFVLIGLGIFMFYTRHNALPELPEVEFPPEETTLVEQTISTSEITLSYPQEFGLAVTAEQVLVVSYIPPCSEGFDYCLYFGETTYQGTNFDSAGVRVKRRSDLQSATACLTTAPEGHADLLPTMTTLGEPSVSRFSPLADAGAGHYAQGVLYRLYSGESCYEFETRMGESQYGNYESGTLQEFTPADRAEVDRLLWGILESVTLNETGEKVIFPR